MRQNFDYSHKVNCVFTTVTRCLSCLRTCRAKKSVRNYFSYFQGPCRSCLHRDTVPNCWRLTVKPIHLRNNQSVSEAYESHTKSKDKSHKNFQHFYGAPDGQLWIYVHSTDGKRGSIHFQVLNRIMPGARRQNDNDYRASLVGPRTGRKLQREHEFKFLNYMTEHQKEWDRCIFPLTYACNERVHRTAK